MYRPLMKLLYVKKPIWTCITFIWLPFPIIYDELNSLFFVDKDKMIIIDLWVDVVMYKVAKNRLKHAIQSFWSFFEPCLGQVFNGNGMWWLIRLGPASYMDARICSSHSYVALSKIERVLIAMTFKNFNVHTDRFTAFRTFITLSI